MKNTKSLLLTFISLALIAASVAIFWKSGFFYPQKKPVAIIADSTNTDSAVQNPVTISEDSVAYEQDYTNIDSIYSAVDSTQTKLNDSPVLQGNSTPADLDEAQQKINLLEQEIERLKTENSDYEKQNQDLFNKLNDKQASSHTTENKSTGRKNFVAKTPIDDNTRDDSNTSSAASYTVSKLSLQAFQIDKENEGEMETDSAMNVSKISALFSFNNADNKNYNGDIMLVITQPNGKAFKGSPWQVGVFETSEGRRIYSCKFQMDCRAGEFKETRIDFFRDDLTKGTYTLQVYKNGFPIGKTKLTLL